MIIANDNINTESRDNCWPNVDPSLHSMYLLANLKIETKLILGKKVINSKLTNSFKWLIQGWINGNELPFRD